MLVLAGAGSGKTRVLTHRIAYLMERGVPPERILAVTFSNRAAREMRDRLLGMLGALPEGLWISTFHAACLRMLRCDGMTVGVRPDFSICDEADQKALIKRCLARLNLSEQHYPPGACISRISQAKQWLVGPEEFARRATGPFEEGVSRVYRAYQQELAASNALDFDDLLVKTVHMLRGNEELRLKWAGRFQYVLVDEYQDTNWAQYVLVQLWSSVHGNVFVVGDEDQGIYGWRGATIRNILDFEADYPRATVLKLEQNYRSTRTILEAANAVISNNRLRKGKRLWTANPPGERVRHFAAGDPQEEAAFVAEEIVRLLKRGFRYRDVAVLYRTHAQSRPLEEAFLRREIPYTILGGVRFYERQEIKDVIAYLRVIANPNDWVSMGRIINRPRRGIGSRTWEKLEAYGRQTGMDAVQVLNNASQVPGLSGPPARAAAELGVMFRRWQEQREGWSLARLLAAVLEESGYLDMLRREGTPEAAERLENLQELFSVVSEPGWEGAPESLEDFLAWVALMTDVDSYQEDRETVACLTLHAAKGLEFPVVFIIGMEEGIFPHRKSMEGPETLEEERRLCYVGMTRAKQRLYLTRSRVRTMAGSRMPMAPSRFLREIPSSLLTTEEMPVVDSEVAGNFRPGDRVIHPRWGPGTVVQCRGDGPDAEVTVAFPKRGLKTLIVKYARLRPEGEAGGECR